MTSFSKIVPLLVASGVLLAACGGSSDAVSVDGAWARASAPSQTRGAVYFELSSDVDDVLTGASVDPAVAADAQLHEVVTADMGDDMAADEGSHDMDDMDESDDMDMGDADMEASMVMQELTDGLALTDGGTVAFEPGGYHLMLLDLVEPLDVGDEFELTLEFAENDDLIVTVPVRESAP